MASKILGVIRDHVLAGTFGAGDTLDAYYAAFRLPDTFTVLVVIGALSAGFLPIFTEYMLRRKDGARDDAWRLTNELDRNFRLHPCRRHRAPRHLRAIDRSRHHAGLCRLKAGYDR